jgi:IS30 family transposase
LGRPKEITNDEAIEVMALAIQGWTVRAIAESVGISKSAVGRIVKESRDDV